MVSSLLYRAINDSNNLSLASDISFSFLSGLLFMLKVANMHFHLENKPRLGLINYVNSLPTVLPIIKNQIDMDAQVVLAEPADLNALYAANKLDCGAMSAFAFLQQHNLQLMPGISISSYGTVGSVLFFSKKDLQKEPAKKIAVPRASATSINALLLLLEQEPLPDLLTLDKPELDSPEIDGALVIGDRALLVDDLWTQKYYRYDLGQWWFDKFSLPMVFAVFAVKGQLDREFIKIGERLLKATEFGLNQFFPTVLDEAEKRTALPRKRLEKYFKSQLRFDWSDAHEQSLTKYKELCQNKGLLTLQNKKILA